ncbi:DNA-binding protein [Streptomyces sp. NPDC006552]|uniref:helix-turn-helix transcriptional regulator n=1 Tax=Streptomyces sp. NPDC006552 TaxID=3157179 RepID=UPI0033ADD308
MKEPKRPTLAAIRSTWPPTVPVSEAATAIGCGRSWLYEAIKRGESPVKTIPVGNRCVVVTADLVRLLSGEDIAA